MPQQRPLRRLGLCGDEAAQDGTRDLVAALKWRGACDRKARSHAMNCRTATDDAMDWGLVRGRGRGGTVGQQGPPHPVLGIRNFLCFQLFLEALGPGKWGWGVQSAIFHRSRRAETGAGEDKMSLTPAGLLSYPYINGGGGLGARWLASPHIRRLLKADGFKWAPCMGSGDDMA